MLVRGALTSLKNASLQAQIGSSRYDYDDQLLSARNSPATFAPSHGKLQLQDPRSQASSPSRADLSSLFAAADPAHTNGSAPSSKASHRQASTASPGLGDSGVTHASQDGLHGGMSAASSLQQTNRKAAELQAAMHCPESLQPDTDHAVTDAPGNGTAPERPASSDIDVEPASVTAIPATAHSPPSDNSNKEKTPARLHSNLPGSHSPTRPGLFLTVKSRATGSPGLMSANGPHAPAEAEQEADFTDLHAIATEGACQGASDCQQDTVAEDAHDAQPLEHGLDATDKGREAGGPRLHDLIAGHQDMDATDDSAVATDDAYYPFGDDDHAVVAEAGADANPIGGSAVANEDAYEAASDEILGDGEASEYSMSRQGSLSGFSIVHTPTSCLSEVRLHFLICCFVRGVCMHATRPLHLKFAQSLRWLCSWQRCGSNNAAKQNALIKCGCML